MAVIRAHPGTSRFHCQRTPLEILSDFETGERQEMDIGALTAIRFHPDGTLTAAAEPTRRGGGSAMVVEPVR